MEQRPYASDNPDDTTDRRKPNMSPQEPSTFDEVVGSWSPNSSQLESFAVNGQEEANLLRSRWQAEICVNVPSYTQNAKLVVENLRASLTGREALVALDRGVIWALFLVTNANDENIELVDRFTAGLVRELDTESYAATLSTITRFDTSDFEQLLPEELREEQIKP